MLSFIHFCLINSLHFRIIPLQYLEGENAESIGLTGKETFDILVPDDVHPHDKIDVVASSGIKFQVIVRFDTDVDIAYYRNGGILNYMIRKMIE
jgi:aconitate hydratase